MQRIISRSLLNNIFIVLNYNATTQLRMKLTAETSISRIIFSVSCRVIYPKNESRLSVTGVVDWEFTYAAPVEFTYAAPWWLLLERPENWEVNLDKSLVRYMPRFHTFLGVLEDCETEEIQTVSCHNLNNYRSLWRNHWRLGYFGFSLFHDIALCLMTSIRSPLIRDSMVRSQRSRIDLVCSVRKSGQKLIPSLRIKCNREARALWYLLQY